ncbi:hypothetical protein O0L34_g12658 [Tuta absoluta]|nr:hypothetical protein O0L34_g12658 [Tuta absoluta]
MARANHLVAAGEATTCCPDGEYSKWYCTMLRLSYADNRWRAPATASYTGGTCAALVQLVRQLHVAPQWHGPITSLLLEKLQLAAQMVSILNGTAPCLDFLTQITDGGLQLPLATLVELARR